MKKNSLKAFEAKAVKVENITGGGYFEPTQHSGSAKQNDSQYVTQKGEMDQTNSVANYDQYDSALCKF